MKDTPDATEAKHAAECRRLVGNVLAEASAAVRITTEGISRKLTTGIM